MSPTQSALVAITLWATLAALGAALTRVPPFLLTGIALVIGSSISVPFVLRDRAAWRVPLRTLALGVYGLFGYHFLLFLAFRHAPAIEANLVNYLWPLLIVVLAPLMLRGSSLRATHIFAALLGLCGAAVAILSARTSSVTTSSMWGLVPALGAALVWSTYSLMAKRTPFPPAAIGLFGLVSGVLALGCHALLEEHVALSTREWTLLLVAGLGPLGAAFWFWNAALRGGDARKIGVLSYVTPLLSTTLLLVTTGRPLTPFIALAAALILVAALIGASGARM